MNTFAKHLKYERASRSWTQEQLAEQLGTTRNTVSLWERGLTFPNPYFRQQLSALFEKPLETLGLFPALTHPSPPLDPAGTPPDLLESRPAVSRFRWNLPSHRNSLFTGRAAILERLQSALHHDQAAAWPQIQAITGLGGIGKTQVALEYTYRSAEAYQSIIWLGAETRELLWADLVALAEALQLVAREDQPSYEPIEAIRGWLQEHSDWLLIVDNLEELALLSKFLPAIHRGHIIVTTRVQAPGPDIERLDLDKMAPEEGALLLLRRAKQLRPTEPLELARPADRRLATTLAELMDGLPLALDQAGAYIEESACGLAHYVSLFQNHQAILLGLRTLSGDTHTDHPHSVRATLALSLERLRQENPAALALLQLCAFLHPEAIPEELLQDEAPEPGSLLEGLARDPLQLDATIANLRRYSLLQRNPEAHSISLHRLVQAVVQDTLEEATQRQWAEWVVGLVNRAFPQVEYASWERCQRLLPQALRCADLIERWVFTFPEAAHLLNQTGDYLRQRGRYTQAQPLLERALSMRAQTLGSAHPDVAKSLNTLAELYLNQGQYAQTLPLLERALSMRAQTLGSAHPDVAETMNKLAATSYYLGRYAQAQPLFEQTLALREQMLGPAHPGVTETMNNLAVTYEELGQYDQAVSLHQRALAVREQTLGPVHPDVAQSLNNLAVLYRELGQHQEAFPLFKRALTIWEQALGSDHPLVATSLYGLATVYYAQGQYGEALPLYQRALAIDEEAYGPIHPEVATDLNSLAILYRELGQHQEAFPLFERALTIREEALGPDHPLVATSLNNLAELYREQGQYEQALALAQRALTIFEQAVGPAHPDVAESLNTLAALAHAQEQYERALPLYQRALAIREQALGPDHPSLARCLEQYASLLRALQQPAQAQVLETRAQNIREDHFISRENRVDAPCVANRGA